jgi:hypothetical protein
MNSAPIVRTIETTSGQGCVASHWSKILEQVILVLFATVFVFWDSLLLSMMACLMPRNDFGRTLWSAIAYLKGVDMYAPNATVYFQFNDHRSIYLWNLNPPHFHLLLLPLAVLPQDIALLLWCLLGGLCLYLSIRLILGEIGLELTPGRRQWVVLGLLAFVGMGTALVTGHMSFPLMLLMTLAWRHARRGNWALAGAWIGLGSSIKPFLLIFFP